MQLNQVFVKMHNFFGLILSQCNNALRKKNPNLFMQTKPIRQKLSRGLHNMFHSAKPIAILKCPGFNRKQD